MRVVVKKSGNGASVQIPAALMEAANLRLDDTVEMREVEGCIVLTPVRVAFYDLAQLIAGITPENQHAEIDTGSPVGKELL